MRDDTMISTFSCSPPIQTGRLPYGHMTESCYAQCRQLREFCCTFPSRMTVAGMVLFFFVVRAEAEEKEEPWTHEALHDHPLVTLFIIFLLCVVIALLHLSRKKIKASERRYRALFQDNGAIMFLVDPVSLKVMDANPAACAFYGWSPADFLNKRIAEIAIGSEADLLEIIQDVLTYERRRFRARHRLASGEERDVEVNSMPYRVDGRECLFSIINDITDDRND